MEKERERERKRGDVTVIGGRRKERGKEKME